MTFDDFSYNAINPYVLVEQPQQVEPSDKQLTQSHLRPLNESAAYEKEAITVKIAELPPPTPENVEKLSVQH